MIKQIVAGVLVFAITTTSIVLYNISKRKDIFEDNKVVLSEANEDFSKYINYNDALNKFITNYINTYVNTFGLQEKLYLPKDFSGYKIAKLSKEDNDYFTNSDIDISKKTLEGISLIDKISDYYSKETYKNDYSSGGRRYHQEFLSFYKEYEKVYDDYLIYYYEKEKNYLEKVQDIYYESKEKEKYYSISVYFKCKEALSYAKDCISKKLS